MENKKPLPRQGGNDDDESSEDSSEREQQTQIFQSGSVTTGDGRHRFHCLTVIGQVEGHYTLPAQNKTTKYEHVIPQLVAIEQDEDIHGLLIILNTVGGDVEAGLAIAELISGMSKPTVSLVLGGGHSIGVPLAVSAKYSFIAPTATMTVHPVRMNGLMLGVPQTLSYFDKMQERISSFVCQNSKIAQDRFLELMMNNSELVMDIGTVLDGESAVAEGLIDSLGGLREAVDKLYELIDSGAVSSGDFPSGKKPGRVSSAEKQQAAGKTRKKPGPKPTAAQPQDGTHETPAVSRKKPGPKPKAAQPQAGKGRGKGGGR